MTYPVGVQLATLTFSNPGTFLGNEATRTEVTVQSTAGVVWTATGMPIDDFAETVAPAAGLPGSLTLPFVDQAGFTDQAGNAFTMWAYVITRRTIFGSSQKIVKKNWAPVIGQNLTDFDNLPGGSIGLPVSAPPVPVTSVATLTGAVDAESLAGELVEFIPSGVTPESVAANLPGRLEADAIAAGLAPKLDADDAATTYAAKSVETSKLDASTAATTYAAKSVETSKADASVLTAHTSNTSNPHSVTKAQVGLSNVDNTADTAKPVSTAQATALALKADQTALTSHTGNVSNPHAVTKAQVGLGSADNTPDTAKPVSAAQQTALALKLDASQKGAASGVAPLDSGQLVPQANLPAHLTVAAQNATYAPATGSPNYTSPATAQGIALVQALIYGA